MIGTSKKAHSYILLDDRDNLEKEQTIFMIKPYGGLDGADIIKPYREAERAGRKGRTEVDRRKWREADIDVWLSIVLEIKNYMFSEDYEDLHKAGFIESITDRDTLVTVAKDITLDQFNEIVEAASSGAVLSPPTESKSKSKSFTGSGKQAI